jgi:hypothetical protein
MVLFSMESVTSLKMPNRPLLPENALPLMMPPAVEMASPTLREAGAIVGEGVVSDSRRRSLIDSAAEQTGHLVGKVLGGGQHSDIVNGTAKEVG